ncbi:hypothetical protein XA68_11738 [Ophiocordyceps unilateralis]|uniref:Copper-fist domain-containing protein n=1 Tax=Ophiocordyceps unilateralis TaxID=268505 RepID=A0A2A9PG77_OPHUN|nr:hypothetical protein XA68_11738 [Ophiocordyceps unilateralis]
MLIDGEKYACEACVRGHRVSNCQHSDRPLQHINKKGRPVSQCQHCRTMRKSRAAHVKCDCGEKTSKCAHLQQPVEGHKETCCCNHGGRCTCCLKKEPSLDTVPESDSDGCEPASLDLSLRPKASTARRRRANTVQSDGILAFDHNGHHKPIAKLNRAAHKCGPYQLNRVNSSASAGSIGSDGMLFSDGQPPAPLPPPASVPLVCGRSRSAAEQRRVKSETASPLMAGAGFPQLNGALPRLDLSGIEYGLPTTANSSFDMFGSRLPPDHEPAVYSAGLSAASVDWSHYELGDTKGDAPPSSYGQGFGGMLDFGSGSEHIPRLANTTSTSGDVSEVEDGLGGGDGDFDPRYGGGGVGNSGFLRQGGGNLGSIDYDSFYHKSAEGAGLIAGAISMVEEDAAFWMPNYNEGIAPLDEAPDPLSTTSIGGFWEM